MKKTLTRFACKVVFFLAGFGAVTAQSDQVGVIYRDDLTGMEGVEVQCAACPQTSAWTNADGIFVFEDLLPGTTYTFIPKKDGDDAEGLTILDICPLRKHILGVESITDPNRLRAADVNLSNSVTTFDIILISRIILQEDAGFSLTDSWVFDPPNIVVDDLTGETIGFLGIKMGDVFREEEAEVADVHTELILPMVPANAVGPVTAEVRVKEFSQIEGLQLSLAWDPDVLQLDTAVSSFLSGFSSINTFQPFPGRLNIWWMAMDGQPLSLPDGAELLDLQFSVLTPSTPVQLAIDPEGIPYQILAEGCALVDVSTVASVNEKGVAFQVVPAGNPSQPGRELNCRIYSDRALDLQCLLTDVSGRIIGKWDQAIPGGMTDVRLPAPQLPGVYFLRIWAPGAGMRTVKWVVGT